MVILLESQYTVYKNRHWGLDKLRQFGDYINHLSFTSYRLVFLYTATFRTQKDCKISLHQAKKLIIRFLFEE